VQGIPITDPAALERLAHSARANDVVVYRIARDSVVLNPSPGITEAQAPDGELYGEERLEVLLRASSALDATALEARIMAATAEFCAGEWQDDATLMVLAVS
jgi:serine phosphatase RsbU (regulator of sigma subunit)